MFLLFSAFFFGLPPREQSEFDIAISIYKNSLFISCDLTLFTLFPLKSH